MKKKKKSTNDPDNPLPTPGLTTEHFDLTLKRWEDVYLKPIKDDVDDVKDSLSRMKLCVEIVCAAIAGSAILYILQVILTMMHLL